MSSSVADAQTIYPQYCHSISPTLGKYCPLQAIDVLGLKEVSDYQGQDIYFIKNHPIKYIRLTGVIVAIDEFESRSANTPGRWIATLDDGSGTNIEAVCAAPPKDTAEPSVLDRKIQLAESSHEPKALISPDGPVLTGLDVGSVVKMKGGITEFRGVRQIRLLLVRSVDDTNGEVKSWNEMLAFRRDILSKPWLVTEEEVKQCHENENIRLATEAEAERRAKREEEKARDRARRHQLKRKHRELLEKRREEQEEKAEKQRKKDRQRLRKEAECAADSGAAGDSKSSRKAKSESSGLKATVSLSRAAMLRAAGKYDALGL